MRLRRRPEPEEPDQRRMTLGEHLEELRGCLIRSLIALALACIVCIWPAKHILALLVRPLVLALRAHGQPDSLLATNPVENIVVYIKVVVIAGLVLAGPYVLYQFWTFVAAGLYRHERELVRRLTLPSAALFAGGVIFMYFFALLVSLNFLVGFSSWLPLPQARPTAIERALLRERNSPGLTSHPSAESWPKVPVVADDPPNPPPGAVWFNLVERRLKVHEQGHTYSYQFQRDDRRAMVTTHFKIGEYLSFVLVLTIAFGIAFQLPLVILFLARSGILPPEKLRRYRKPAILGIVIIAGMLAPPDLLSHILLSGPMIILFEIGLFLAGRSSKKTGSEKPGNEQPKVSP